MPDFLRNIPPHNIPAYWSALYINELWKHGLRHAVVSPGSRSTPLTLAVANHPGIKSHVVLDERSAGFTALGIGMSTGKPAALICTSGTAVANYYPAVCEAHASGIPMLVLSADRPPNQRQTGANQAMNQLNLFGGYAKFFHEAGEPVMQREDLDRLELLAAQTMYACVREHGISHVNFPFRKPFEPDADFLHQLPSLYASWNANSAPDNTFTDAGSDKPLVVSNTITDLIRSARKPVIVASYAQQAKGLMNLAEDLADSGIPTLAEAGSLCYDDKDIPVSIITSYDALFRSADTRNALRPDLIIQIGGTPVCKGLELYLKSHSDVKHIRFHRKNTAADPFLSGGLHVILDDHSTITAPKPDSLNKDWLQEWKNAEKSLLDSRAPTNFNKNELLEGDVYRILTEAYPDPASYMISNSFPARDITIFGLPDMLRHNVYLNRGVSGIDGITSTAAGISLGSNRTVTLITGDLAFLHDINALLTLKQFAIPLRIIVIDNRGGGIFRMLPVNDGSAMFKSYFETPQEVDWNALCNGFGITSVEVDTCDALRESLSAPVIDSPQIIICRVNPDASMDQRRSLWN